MTRRFIILSEVFSKLETMVMKCKTNHLMSQTSHWLRVNSRCCYLKEEWSKEMTTITMYGLIMNHVTTPTILQRWVMLNTSLKNSSTSSMRQKTTHCLICRRVYSSVFKDKPISYKKIVSIPCTRIIHKIQLKYECKGELIDSEFRIK